MRLELLCREKKPGLEDWFNKHAGSMNAEFQKENIFDKLYKHLPRIVRSKIPFDIILENKKNMKILDSFSITYVTPGVYQIIMIFNEPTLIAFDGINHAVSMLPKWVKKQFENALYHDSGSRLEDTTRQKIIDKTIRAIQYNDRGQEEVIILEKKVYLNEGDK